MIDVGIDAELIPGVISMRVARGCGNITVGRQCATSQAELLLEVMRYTGGWPEDGVAVWRRGARNGQYHPGGGNRRRPDRQR